MPRSAYYRASIVLLTLALLAETPARSQLESPVLDETADPKVTAETPVLTAEPPAPAGVTVLRDPFWPVGYQPRPRQSESTAAPPIKHEMLQWPQLILKGITQSGSKYSAILAEVGLIEEGDVISLRQGELIFRWRITRITTRGVSHTKLDVRTAGE